VIHSDVKKEKISSAFTIMSRYETFIDRMKLDKKNRQKRGCCQALMQGKPLELNYELRR
jgi:hypothetical protein